MSDLINRLHQRWRLIKNHGAELNRRVEIENQLLSMATGKTPLPTTEDCRVMALKLGTPKEYWREAWKKKIL